MHVVIVDNGRSGILAKENFRRSLTCIRCGACMNTCPVFRRSGGYSYGYTVPGPIGSLLGPLRDLKAHRSLPFACSLCASCTDVCPVKVDLHSELYLIRQDVADRNLLPLHKRLAMALAARVMVSAALYRIAGRLMRVTLRTLPRSVIYGSWNPWGRQRELPMPPAKSFRELMEQGQDE